ncbi:MAG TPA: hypothetical protein PLQ01_07235 [Methanothrix sp.]|nr:hypothetical protein [Methanothrix sp.]
MFDLTYDLWKEIIADIVSAHEPLFSALHQAAEDIQLTKDLVDDLKKKREIAVASDPWEIALRLDFVGDEIGGFIIFLAAEEAVSTLEQIKADIASEYGLSPEDIEAFEIDCGLNMQEETLEEMEEVYGVRADVAEEGKIVYELVVFDSRDIDDSLYSDMLWQEDIDN